MVYWKKRTADEIRARIREALNHNTNFFTADILGVPASHLDDRVFSHDASFLKDTPFLQTLTRNPNHIGCHTLGESEPFFSGTQAIEREVIALCAEDILHNQPGQTDGYIASGGTEANIQALWTYRNYWMAEHDIASKAIAVVCSADSHYSIDKGANLLQIQLARIPVESTNRMVDKEALRTALAELRAGGITHVIAVANMMTTMFGSVDDPAIYVAALQAGGFDFFLHIDGAYGGFVYPFSNRESTLDFSNPHVSSITLDAHKMAQAPYGTGIFLIRKGLITYTHTDSARYVHGHDYTLIGSRSGANAVAVWMILMTYGPYGWYEKIQILQLRTQWLCLQLDQLGIDYYRHPHANLVTLAASFVSPDLAKNYGLVPDDHENPQWYKVVVMDHVTVDRLEPLIAALAMENATV